MIPIFIFVAITKILYLIELPSSIHHFINLHAEMNVKYCQNVHNLKSQGL